MTRVLHSHFFLPLLISFLFLSASSFAVGIKGKIKDDKTKEMIVGATVYLKQTSFSAFTELDGSYHLKNIPAGTYTLVATFIGYLPKEKTITVSDKDLHLDFSLTENAMSLEEVTVGTTAEAGSDVQSRKIEQNSESVVSVLSAKTIQMMPDLNVGSISQRVSGVSIVRNGNGDGQYAIIRGMDQRYNYTTINGLKIPSPDNKNRYIPLDIFPADLLERMEVVKALTPSMEGDAIGGAMNLQMKSAPSERLVLASISGGYSEVISKNPFTIFNTKNINFNSPFDINGITYKSQVSDYSLSRLRYHEVKVPVSTTYGLTLGDRLLKKKLGIVIAGSFQNLYRSHNGIFYNIAGQPNPGNIVSNNGIDRRYYSSLQQRGGVHLNVDYKLGKHTTVSLYNVFVQLSEALHREKIDIRTTDVGEYSSFDRSTYQRQRVNSSSLKIEHNFLPTMKLSLTANYSLADNRIPDQVELAVKERVDRNTTTGQIMEPGFYINSMTHRWYRNTDKDKGLYATFIYSITPWFEVNAGGLTKSKRKDNYYTENTLNAFGSNSIGQPYSGLDNVVLEFRPEPNAYNDSTDANNYVATEKISAAYLQTKFLFFKQLQILGGLRLETTAQSYTSAISASTPGKSGTIQYKDFLPSVHSKWALNKKSNLRASYYKGIARPALFEFIPAAVVGDYFTEIGNPYLKHTKASNYDLRFEHFMNADEQFLIGGFYKKIINPIEYSFAQIFNNSYYYAPSNFGTATNFGFELVFAKFYKKFGLSGNYTFTESQITTTKRTIEANGTPGSVSVTRPLQGQSKHIANVAVLYKNKKAGLDLRISWVYTGERINIVSAFVGMDYWQRPMQQFDFSGEKKIGKHLSVFVKATNLFNAQTIVEIRSPLPDYFVGNPEQTDPSRVLVSRDQFGRTYYAGLRFKL